MDLGLFLHGFGMLVTTVGAAFPLVALFMRSDSDQQED